MSDLRKTDIIDVLFSNNQAINKNKSNIVNLKSNVEHIASDIHVVSASQYANLTNKNGIYFVYAD